MMKLILLFLFIVCVYGCKNKSKAKEPDVKLISIQQEENEHPVPPPPPSALHASAWLIYDDGSLSDFDVLNDKSKALWNVIIGAGDAEKPSEKVKLVFEGAYDSIHIKVKNGKKLALNKKNLSFTGRLEFIIQNTGCDEVVVSVTKYKTIILQDTIPFHCGE
jgi:hypothetical protein